MLTLHLTRATVTLQGDDFIEFVDELGRMLSPGKIFILDNCGIHMSPQVRATAQAHGHTVVYLPSYSPFLNPIEFFFSELKGALAGPRRCDFDGIIGGFPPDAEEAGVHAALTVASMGIPRPHFASWITKTGHYI